MRHCSSRQERGLWGRETTKVRYTDITRIDFADHYNQVITDPGGEASQGAGAHTVS